MAYDPHERPIDRENLRLARETASNTREAANSAAIAAQEASRTRLIAERSEARSQLRDFFQRAKARRSVAFHQCPDCSEQSSLSIDEIGNSGIDVTLIDSTTRPSLEGFGPPIPPLLDGSMLAFKKEAWVAIGVSSAIAFLMGGIALLFPIVAVVAGVFVAPKVFARYGEIEQVKAERARLFSEAMSSWRTRVWLCGNCGHEFSP